MGKAALRINPLRMRKGGTGRRQGRAPRIITRQGCAAGSPVSWAVREAARWREGAGSFWPRGTCNPVASGAPARGAGHPVTARTLKGAVQGARNPMRPARVRSARQAAWEAARRGGVGRHGCAYGRVRPPARIVRGRSGTTSNVPGRCRIGMPRLILAVDAVRGRGGRAGSGAGAPRPCPRDGAGAAQLAGPTAHRGAAAGQSRPGTMGPGHGRSAARAVRGCPSHPRRRRGPPVGQRPGGTLKASGRPGRRPAPSIRCLGA